MNDQVMEEKVLKKVMRNIPFGLVVSREGRQRKIYYVNQTAYQMLGYTKEEYVRKVEQSWNNILDVDLREVLQDYHEKIRDGESFEMTVAANTKDGRKRWLSCRAIVRMETEPVSYVSIMDATEKVEREKSWKKERELLREMASRDSFTKLLNRGTMEQKIEAVLARNGARGEHAFVALDVDNFKQINDLYGHYVGDMLILELAGLLREQFKGENYIGRMGGDEFAVFAKNIKERREIKEMAEQVLKGLHDRKNRMGLSEEPSVSIGIAFSPENGRSFQELYNRADEMLYRVKKEKKNGIAVFEEEEN